MAREVFSLSSPGKETPDWRVSLAAISTRAPFSTFPGIDRTMCILSENGIQLEIDTRKSVVLYRNSEPFHFAGETVVSGSPLAGEALNINFMARRGKVRHHVERMRKTESSTLPYGSLGNFLFCTNGKILLTTQLHSIDLAVFDAAYLPRGEDYSWNISPSIGSEWILATLDEM